MKIKIGDIFEIETPGGKAYLHYVSHNGTAGEIVRVLQGLYSQKPDNLEEIVLTKERYFIHFPLAAAHRKKIVKWTGYFTADDFQKPQYMRVPHIVGNEFLGWHIVDTENWKRTLVNTLTDEQTKYSPWGVWNDTVLIERLVEGWTLEKWTESYQ